MKKIGITETYDPHFIKDWHLNLKDINIIITKQLSDCTIEKLISNKDKCILHLTCTGLGGSIYEPNVPQYTWSYEQLQKLIKGGFPLAQCVLRIDPIIPNNDGLCALIHVLNRFKMIGHEYGESLRCRISMMDYYHHVQERFKTAGVSLTHTLFHAPLSWFEEVDSTLMTFTEYFNFESCAESMFNDIITEKTGCVSTKDIEIMKQNPDDYSSKLKCNRDGCSCIEKVNILKCKPSQCPHKCLYCYWKDNFK